MLKVFSTRGLRSVIGAACALGFAGSGSAAAVSYDFVSAGYAFGSGYNSSLSGGEGYTLVSSNLPVNLNTGFLSYGFGAAANPGSQASGSWELSNGTDILRGTFETSAIVENGFAGTPFTRYTGVRTVTGGEGYFANATGSGTYELYATFFDTGDPDFFAYQGVEIARMSVTVDVATPIGQTDFRGASVLVKNGVENSSTNQGSNFGYYTTGSPSLLPLPETNESSYTFVDYNNPLPFVGTFLDTSPGGTISGTTYGDNISYGHLGSIFNFASGEAVTTDATGQFAGARFATDYESFAIGTGYTDPIGTYSAIILNRVAPVPEPETWALMLAGLGLLGAAVRRRSR